MDFWDALGVAVRPLTALVLFGGAALLAWRIKRHLPEGAIKRLLYEQHAVSDPKSNACWYLLAATVAQFAIIDLVLWLSGGAPIFLKFLP